MPDSKQSVKIVEFSSFVLEWDMTMRHEKETLLKEELRVLAIITRDRLGLTQKEMGRRLAMSESCYSDIETGRTMCSTLTAVLLLEMQEDPRDFLVAVHVKFDMQYDKAMQTV